MTPAILYDVARDFGSLIGACVAGLAILVSISLAARSLRIQQDQFNEQMLKREDEARQVQAARARSMKLWYRGELYDFAVALCRFTDIGSYVMAWELSALKAGTSETPRAMNLHEIAAALIPSPFACDPNHALDLGLIVPPALRDSIFRSASFADSAMRELKSDFAYIFQLTRSQDRDSTAFPVQVAETQLRAIPGHFKLWQHEFSATLRAIDESLDREPGNPEGDGRSGRAAEIAKLEEEVRAVAAEIERSIAEFLPTGGPGSLGGLGGGDEPGKKAGPGSLPVQAIVSTSEAGAEQRAASGRRNLLHLWSSRAKLSGN